MNNKTIFFYFLHRSYKHTYQRCFPTYKNAHNFTEKTERKRLDVKNRYE